MSDEAAEKPKLIIDEDWKSQVQAEKEALHRQQPQRPAAAPGEQKPSAEERPDYDLPPATLPVLCTTLATQALMALGQVADPAAGQPIVRLDEARHFIDLLEMLQQKTSGNRTPEESNLLENLLHELRMAYVGVSGSEVGGRKPEA